jgi:hypothetical protein
VCASPLSARDAQIGVARRTRLVRVEIQEAAIGEYFALLGHTLGTEEHALAVENGLGERFARLARVARDRRRRAHKLELQTRRLLDGANCFALIALHNLHDVSVTHTAHQHDTARAPARTARTV